MNKIDRLLVLTKTLRGVFIQQGVEERRITVLPHGVDASDIQRTDQRGLQATLLVGFLGQIAEHKGCHLLIEAVRSLPNLPVLRFGFPRKGYNVCWLTDGQAMSGNCATQFNGHVCYAVAT